MNYKNSKFSRNRRSSYSANPITRTKSMYLAVLVFLLSPLAANADLILDQAVEVNSGGVNQGFGLAQTFTVGVTGLLVQVDVDAFTQVSQTAQIRILGTLADGSPDVSNVLANTAQNLPAPTNPVTFDSIDFSAFSIPVNTGDVLAIEIKNIGGTLNWQFNNTESYTSGGAFAVIDGFGGTYAPFNSSGAPGSDLLFRTFVETDVTPNLEAVTIDIKPGSDPNCFNANGHGVIPVAILGSSTFDVTLVDLSTLSFGGLEVRVRGNKGSLCNFEDSDGDTILDLVCHFEDDSTNWAPGDGDATLTGTLLDGTTEFEGTDTICVVP